MRPSGRAADQLRPVRLEAGFAKYAEGSRATATVKATSVMIERGAR